MSTAGQARGTEATREWLAARMDPVAFAPPAAPFAAGDNLGQFGDRRQRQQAALAHAEIAVRLLRPAPGAPDTTPEPAAEPAAEPRPRPGYDRPGERRRAVARARAEAGAWRAAAAAGERAVAASAWPERGRAAAAACRALAAFLANHPTDPVAIALTAALTVDPAPHAGGDPHTTRADRVPTLGGPTPGVPTNSRPE